MFVQKKTKYRGKEDFTLKDETDKKRKKKRILM